MQQNMLASKINPQLFGRKYKIYFLSIVVLYKAVQDLSQMIITLGWGTESLKSKEYSLKPCNFGWYFIRRL